MVIEKEDPDESLKQIVKKGQFLKLISSDKILASDEDCEYPNKMPTGIEGAYTYIDNDGWYLYTEDKWVRCMDDFTPNYRDRAIPIEVGVHKCPYCNYSGNIDDLINHVVNSHENQFPIDILSSSDVESAKYEYARNSIYKSLGFVYTIPYNFIINTRPLYGMYFLTTIDTKKFLDFTYINENCMYQYIATNIQWSRNYKTNPDMYEMTINVEQNITTNDKEADQGQTLRCIAVLYDEEDNPYRYSIGTMQTRTNEDIAAGIYRFKFRYKTDDYIDIDNRIRIQSDISSEDIIISDNSFSYPDNMPDGIEGKYTNIDNTWYVYGDGQATNDEGQLLYIDANGNETVVAVAANGDINTPKIIKRWNLCTDNAPCGLYEIGSSEETSNDYAYFTSNTKCVLHFVYVEEGQSRGLNDLDQIVPWLFDKGYSLTNSYTIQDGIDFFYDYSDIVNSTVSASPEMNSIGEVQYDARSGKVAKEYFVIKDVPVVKYDYFNSEDKAIYFCKELVKRKNYIDYAVQVLEDAFGMDFKFFNTYGPSKLFTTDNAFDYLNKVNLSLTFKTKLKPNYDTNIINNIISDIKDYIEDINNINTIHMSNLVSSIIEKYKESIEFFEFIDMNGYGSGVQHLYSMDMPEEVIVPEFVNVNALDDGTPDINLILA